MILFSIVMKKYFIPVLFVIFIFIIPVSFIVTVFRNPINITVEEKKPNFGIYNDDPVIPVILSLENTDNVTRYVEINATMSLIDNTNFVKNESVGYYTLTPSSKKILRLKYSIYLKGDGM